MPEHRRKPEAFKKGVAAALLPWSFILYGVIFGVLGAVDYAALRAGCAFPVQFVHRQSETAWDGGWRPCAKRMAGSEEGTLEMGSEF